jgi:DNA repair ATPase RecN
VRHGQNKAEESAAFDVSNQEKIQAYLQTHSLEEDGECILRRIISSDGRSKAFVNGINVPLSVLRGVGELLIDMHGHPLMNAFANRLVFFLDCLHQKPHLLRLCFAHDAQA